MLIPAHRQVLTALLLAMLVLGITGMPCLAEQAPAMERFDLNPAVPTPNIPGFDFTRPPAIPPALRPLEQELRTRVYSGWQDYEGKSSDYVVLSFQINADGSLSNEKVKLSSGNLVAEAVALTGLRASAPFASMAGQSTFSGVAVNMIFIHCAPQEVACIPSRDRWIYFFQAPNSVPATGEKPLPGAVKKPEIDFGPYIAYIMKKVRGNWHPPSRARTNRVRSMFRVLKDGSIPVYVITVSSGNEEVDAYAIRAIKESAPLQGWPKEYEKPSIDIDFAFDYEVFPYGRLQQESDAPYPLEVMGKLFTEWPGRTVFKEDYEAELTWQLSDLDVLQEYTLSKSSGNTAFDAKVLEAAEKARLKGTALKRIGVPNAPNALRLVFTSETIRYPLASLDVIKKFQRKKGWRH